jgi:hypothetical protein
MRRDERGASATCLASILDMLTRSTDTTKSKTETERARKQSKWSIVLGAAPDWCRLTKCSRNEPENRPRRKFEANRMTKARRLENVTQKKFSRNDESTLK